MKKSTTKQVKGVPPVGGQTGQTQNYRKSKRRS